MASAPNLAMRVGLVGCFQQTQEVRTSERWARRVASTQVCLVVVAVSVSDAALDLD